MLKVSLSSEHHRNAVFVGSSDDLIVFLRAARLNYAGHACIGGIFNIS
jgi:hypothetical protein